MKNLAFALLAGGMLAATGLKAQTIDEIVNKHNEAIGGEKNWKKVSSIVYTGSMSAQGMDIPVSKSILTAKGMRMDMEVMGQKGYVIFTPTKGWAFMPFQGMDKVQELPAEAVKGSQDELEITDDLMSYKARGGKAELAGKETIDGKESFKINCTDKNNSVTTLYVDPATYYIVRKISSVPGQGEQTINWSDYKKLPEGIVVPMTQKSESGDLKLTKVEVNTIKDEKIFQPQG